MNRTRATKGATAGLSAMAAGIVALATALAPVGAGALPLRPSTVPSTNFNIGAKGASGGDVAVAPNGTAYITYDLTNGSDFTSAYLCVLPRGARACSVTTELPPLDSSTTAESPTSVVLGPDGFVYVLVTTSNDSNADDNNNGGGDADTLYYELNPAGSLVSFGTRVGVLDGQGNALLDGNSILWTDNNGLDAGVQYQTTNYGSFPNLVQPTSVDLSSTPAKTEGFFYSVNGTLLPNGDLLFAWDDSTNAYTVEVNIFNQVVGSEEFKNEVVTGNDGGLVNEDLSTGPSGTYLMLESSNTGFSGRIEVLKYVGAGKFGAPTTVINTNTDFGYPSMVEDASGMLMVSFVSAGKLVQYTSSNGDVSWTGLTYPSATPGISSGVETGLTSCGTGVTFVGAFGKTNNGFLPTVQTITGTRSVTSVPKLVYEPEQGTILFDSGKSSCKLAGQAIQLQKEVGTTWTTVASGTTAADGTFTVQVSTPVPVDANYRITASAIPGWFTGTTSPTTLIDVTKPTLTNAAVLSAGKVGTYYAVHLKVAGGEAPYDFSLVSGSLDGLTLSSAGVLSGKPTAQGTKTLTIKVRDNYFSTATKVFTLKVT